MRVGRRGLLRRDLLRVWQRFARSLESCAVKSTPPSETEEKICFWHRGKKAREVVEQEMIDFGSISYSSSRI